MKAVFLLAIIAIASCAALQIHCPDDLDPERILVRHPCNCHSYFVCGTEPPTAMECPSGLQFSQDEQRCDYSWVVKCKIDPTCPKIHN